jgi:uncharacterized membrane protein
MWKLKIIGGADAKILPLMIPSMLVVSPNYYLNYIAFLLVPLFLFFQHPLTLLFLKSFSFCFGAFIFYKIAKKELSEISAVIFLLVYLFIIVLNRVLS